ncbi:MAG: hypothetical protein GX799_00245 [Crenarchaeota archaeon]|jgi:hypothetical protein|nr:hypothetical protein [Thermoproteota archaeon]
MPITVIAMMAIYSRFVVEEYAKEYNRTITLALEAWLSDESGAGGVQNRFYAYRGY